MTLSSSESEVFDYACGTRNCYDIAFADNGDVFCGDNAPDADYPDEINWVRPGLLRFPVALGHREQPHSVSQL